jgi:hypothetical protein
MFFGDEVVDDAYHSYLDHLAFIQQNRIPQIAQFMAVADVATEWSQ